jgi:phage tail tape-measure protein
MATIRDRYILEVDTVGGIRNMGNATAAVGRLDGSLRAIRSVAGIAAAALATVGAASFVSNVAEVTARTQDLKTALETVTGSAANADAAFGFINEFATKTPFNIEELTNTFIKLQSAGITPTEELLTSFGDAASVSTDRVGSLTAMADLFSRSVSGGLGLEDLNRLADRGINVFGILEDQLGITRLEVSEFGKTAEGAQQIRDALIAGFDEEFGGGMARAADNISVAFSNLGIAADNTLLAVGDGGLGAGLQHAATAITELLGSSSGLAETLGSVLGAAIVTVTDFIVGLIEKFQEGGPQVDYLKTLFETTAETLGSLFTAFQEIAVAISPLTDLIFPVLGSLVELVGVGLQALAEILSLLATVLAPIVEGLMPAFQSALEFIQTAIQNTIEFIDRMVERMRSLRQTAREIGAGVGDAFEEMGTKISDTAGAATENVKGFFGGMYDYVVGNSVVPDMVEEVLAEFGFMNQGMGSSIREGAQAVANGFDGIASNISRGFNSFVSEALNGVSSQVNQISNGIFGQLQGLATSVDSSFGGIFSNIGNIFSGGGGGGGGNFLGGIADSLFGGIDDLFAGFFANGGVIPRGQFGVVGERGPELISGPAQITPMDQMGSQQFVTYNINATDARSFRDLLARDPGFIHAIAQQGARRVPGRF